MEVTSVAIPRKKRRRTRRRILLLVLIVLALMPWTITQLVGGMHASNSWSDISKLSSKHHRVGLVLGAGLRDGHPTPILIDRLNAGLDAYKRGKVDRLIVSGDNQKERYDEPTAMRQWLIRNGVPNHHVAADYGGRRTWDSCKRTKDVFQVKKLLIITSEFHVSRAVILCRAAGLDHVRGYGVSSNRYTRGNRIRWRVREVIADARGLYDAWIHHPAVAVGGTKIDIYDSCELEKSLSKKDETRDLDEYCRDTIIFVDGDRPRELTPPLDQQILAVGFHPSQQ